MDACVAVEVSRGSSATVLLPPPCERNQLLCRQTFPLPHGHEVGSVRGNNNAVGIMDNPVKDGVSDGAFTDFVMPVPNVVLAIRLRGRWQIAAFGWTVSFLSAQTPLYPKLPTANHSKLVSVPGYSDVI